MPKKVHSQEDMSGSPAALAEGSSARSFILQRVFNMGFGIRGYSTTIATIWPKGQPYLEAMCASSLSRVAAGESERTAGNI